MDWLSWLEKKQGGTGGTRKYWLYADGKTSKEAGWHNQIHDDDSDEMERGSAKITHDHDGNEGYFGVTLRNHLSDSQRSHINQQIKENRYHQFPKNISFDHGHNNNDTVNSSKKYYPKNQHIAEPKDDDYKNAAWEAWLEKEDKEIKKKPTMFPRIRREFEDEKDEDPMVYDNKTASWESWLEKEEKPKERDYLAEMQTQGEQNMYQNSSKKKKFLKEAKGAGKKIEQQMGENDLPLSYSNRLRTNIKRPAKRVTGNNLSDLDGWVEETKSWESWLEKACKGGNCGDRKMWEAFRTHHYENKDRKRSKEDLDIFDSNIIIHDNNGAGSKELKNTNSGRRLNDRIRTTTPKAGAKRNQIDVELAHEMKSWEVWLEKNNAIETSHKEGEKKEEWNGKFDNSTTRDDAENDDDKAVSEEESLEELTDGKLEEVEKLKSWELWLEKGDLNQTGGIKQNKFEVSLGDGDKGLDTGAGTGLKTSEIAAHDKGVLSSDSARNAITGKLQTGRGNLGNKDKEISHKKTERVGSTTATVGGGRLGGDRRLGTGKHSLDQSHPASEQNRDGTYTVTEDGTREEMKRMNYHWDDDENVTSTGQPPTKDQKDLNDVLPAGTTPVKSEKSWEIFLEKGVTYKEQNVGVHKEQPYAKARTAKEIREAAENVKTEIVLDKDMKKKKSWEGWLDKMQGAGDARYGNQHLTGMEQKPVADDESIELSAESEENNEKQEKTEDKEDKDNKPYKALSQE